MVILFSVCTIFYYKLKGQYQLFKAVNTLKFLSHKITSLNKYLISKQYVLTINPSNIAQETKCIFKVKAGWVNLNKRGGMNGVFRGLAGLLRWISQGQSPREIPRSSPASPRKHRPSRLFYSDLHSISNRVFLNFQNSNKIWSRFFCEANLGHFWWKNSKFMDNYTL